LGCDGVRVESAYLADAEEEGEDIFEDHVDGG
jgi:hypothetical protein